MYKVLEVREYKSEFHGYYSHYNDHSITIHDKRFIVVICENEENNKRERFVFYKGYQRECFGDTYYYGYSGDFDLLIAGDRFEIKETSTYQQVNIIKKRDLL